MRKFLQVIVLVCLLVFTAFVTRADEIEDITKQLASLTTELNNKESDKASIAKQMAGIRARVVVIGSEVEKKEKEVAEGEKNLVHQKKLLDERARSYYKNINKSGSAFISLLIGENFSDSLQNFFYQKVIVDEDRNAIVKIVLYIKNLEDTKLKLVEEKKQLAYINEQLDEQTAKLDKEIIDVKKQITTLSEKQKSIVAARSGSAVTSVGSVPLGSDPNASIGYKSSAPAGSFAAFSFGAYTHRNGMSQYGAKKQAETKDYKDIIQWYYGHGVKKDDGMSDSINVEGHGDMSFQTYLYGIAEMPSSWPLNALKAQAVAARTYANRAGKPICTSESCQVFLKSKSDSPPTEWKQAVDETNKEIIDGDVSSQYSSTTGGYTNTSGWDTTDRSNGGDWTSRAWESMAGSPWFYRGWYRQGYSDGGNSCGRSHPWLSQEEMSDIVNAWIVRKNPNGADTNRIIPVTIGQCPVGGMSGDPYPMNELRDKGGVSSVSSMTTSNNGSGQTTNVHVETNKGSFDIPGSEFKETYNLRAPGYISIPQSGFAFFNIERN